MNWLNRTMLGEHNYSNYQVENKIVKTRISAHEVQMGMYVVELDRPWIETPFLFQGFLVSTQEEVDQLQTLCRHVYIDLEQSEKVRARETLSPTKKPSYTKDRYKTAIEEALPKAAGFYRTAKSTVDTTLAALRLSEDIDTQQLKGVVQNCVKSVIDNPNAMLWLTQIKNKDDYTAEHSLRVAVLAIALGREMELLELELEDLGVAAMLHDVGKIKIPDEVLNKEGNLSGEEYDLIKTHTIEGRKLLLSKTKVPGIAVDVAFCHHEQIDGCGYPRGIKGDKIPQFAKMVAIVDAFDAMTSERVYSAPRTTMEALRILYDCRGTQFDDELVRAFIRLVGIYPPGQIAELSTGEVGIILSCPADNKLKPKVLIVRDPAGQPCSERIVNLARQLRDKMGNPLRIRSIHKDGAFDISLEYYRDKGLKFGPA